MLNETIENCKQHTLIIYIYTARGHGCNCHNQGYEAERKMDAIGVSFLFPKCQSVSVSCFISPEKNTTEAEHFSVGFSDGFSVEPSKKKKQFKSPQCGRVGILWRPGL